MKEKSKDSRFYARARNKYTNYHVNRPSTLMEFLAEKMPDASRTTLKAFLSNKQVYVNKKIISQYNHELNKGDLVQILNTKHKKTEFKNKDVSILYEDAYILVVDKKAGLLSAMSAGRKGKSIQIILNNYLKRTNHKAEVYLIHKLEQEESGIMIYAKDEKTKRNFQERWKQFIINYTLVGIVEGEIPNDKGSVVSWIDQDRALQFGETPEDAPEDAIKAYTKYRVIKRANGLSMLEFDQLEDRNNKIQIQMAHIGFPLLGDRRYGKFVSPLKRMPLHAFLVRFRHPVTNELMKFELPYPRDFRNLVARGEEQEGNKEEKR